MQSVIKELWYCNSFKFMFRMMLNTQFAIAYQQGIMYFISLYACDRVRPLRTSHTYRMSFRSEGISLLVYESLQAGVDYATVKRRTSDILENLREAAK